MKKLYIILLLLCPLLSIAQQRPNLFVGISLNNTTSTISSDDNSYPQVSTSYIFPELHFGANVFVEKLKNISFRFEATATYNMANYQMNGATPSESYSNSTKIKDFSIGVNPQLIYSFNNTNPGNFYIGAGIAAYAIESSYNNIRHSSYMGNPFSLTGTETDNTEITTFAATLKAGYNINTKFDVYLGYNVRFAQYNGGLLRYRTDSYISDQYAFKLGINYRLGRR